MKRLTPLQVTCILLGILGAVNTITQAYTYRQLYVWRDIAQRAVRVGQEAATALDQCRLGYPAHPVPPPAQGHAISRSGP